MYMSYRITNVVVKHNYDDLDYNATAARNPKDRWYILDDY